MFYNSILNSRMRPFAVAKIRGSHDYPSICGTALFYKVQRGVLVSLQIKGLPREEELCKSPIFAVHIHSGDSCRGNNADPFANAMPHYNPDNCNHPYHAGDLPPIFGVDGTAFSAVLTNRFSAGEIIGKTVIIHASPDDFTTQPSGNSSTKIACGEILSVS